MLIPSSIKINHFSMNPFRGENWLLTFNLELSSNYTLFMETQEMLTCVKEKCTLFTYNTKSTEKSMNKFTFNISHNAFLKVFTGGREGSAAKGAFNRSRLTPV